MNIIKPENPVVGVRITIEDDAAYRKITEDMLGVISTLNNFDKGTIMNTLHEDCITAEDIVTTVRVMQFMHETVESGAMWQLSD